MADTAVDRVDIDYAGVAGEESIDPPPEVRLVWTNTRGSLGHTSLGEIPSYHVEVPFLVRSCRDKCHANV